MQHQRALEHSPSGALQIAIEFRGLRKWQQAEYCRQTCGFVERAAIGELLRQRQCRRIEWVHAAQTLGRSAAIAEQPTVIDERLKSPRSVQCTLLEAPRSIVVQAKKRSHNA